MRLISLVTLVFLSMFLFSCTGHAPPENIVRSMCEGEIRRTIVIPGTAEKPVGDLTVNIIEISRKGVSESKNTRGIPDKTFVYPIDCLFQTSIDGVRSEQNHIFLYFFRNREGEWQMRGRL